MCRNAYVCNLLHTERVMHSSIAVDKPPNVKQNSHMSTTIKNQKMTANTTRKPNRNPNTATQVNHTNTTMNSNNTKATLQQQKLTNTKVYTNNRYRTYKCMHQQNKQTNPMSACRQRKLTHQKNKQTNKTSTKGHKNHVHEIKRTQVAVLVESPKHNTKQCTDIKNPNSLPGMVDK